MRTVGIIGDIVIEKMVREFLGGYALIAGMMFVSLKLDKKLTESKSQ